MKKKSNYNPKSLQNLRPCKKGETHNPLGLKKKGKRLQTILAEILDKKVKITDPITKQPDEKEISEVLMLKLVAAAIQGDLKAINLILERLEGKPDQHITGDGLGAPATIVVQNVSTLKELQKLNE